MKERGALALYIDSGVKWNSKKAKNHAKIKKKLIWCKRFISTFVSLSLPQRRWPPSPCWWWRTGCCQSPHWWKHSSRDRGWSDLEEWPRVRGPGSQPGGLQLHCWPRYCWQQRLDLSDLAWPQFHSRPQTLCRPGCRYCYYRRWT